MAIQGEVYATVDAQAVNNGINTLAVSGNTPIAGDETLSVVILWSYDPTKVSGGITGYSWFIGETYSPISDDKYSSDQDFNSKLADMLQADMKSEIEKYMNGWTSESKKVFWDTERENVYGCLDLV